MVSLNTTKIWMLAAVLTLAGASHLWNQWQLLSSQPPVFQAQRKMDTPEWEKIQHAAQQGNKEAQYTLGLDYLRLSGVALERKETKAAQAHMAQALDWLSKSATQEYAPAITQYARLLETKDPVQARVLLKKAASLNEPVALYLLGTQTLKGTPQDPADPARGLELLYRAQKQEYAPAMVVIAQLLYEGAGIEKNVIEAVLLLTRATKAEADALRKTEYEATLAAWVGKLTDDEKKALQARLAQEASGK